VVHVKGKKVVRMLRLQIQTKNLQVSKLKHSRWERASTIEQERAAERLSFEKAQLIPKLNPNSCLSCCAHTRYEGKYCASSNVCMRRNTVDLLGRLVKSLKDCIHWGGQAA